MYLLVKVYKQAYTDLPECYTLAGVCLVCPKFWCLLYIRIYTYIVRHGKKGRVKNDLTTLVVFDDQARFVRNAKEQENGFNKKV